MKVDPAVYEGRGPALVKHTFILSYLPTLIAKVASKYDEFVYVDLFAGPWEERTTDFSDTAFGIALDAMRGGKSVWKRNGRPVKMTAHLVDINPDAIGKQKQLAQRYPDIAVHHHEGMAEDKIQAILASLPHSAFCFVYVDPKGVPDVRKFQAAIGRPNTEVFLNFMYKFATRFAHTPHMPTLEWLTEGEEGELFKLELSSLKGIERENALTHRARLVLARMGNYRYSPAITVDEEAIDRCRYKLIFLSRHNKGILVFRNAQRAALQMQAFNRSSQISIKKAKETGMDDLFRGLEPVNPGERSAREIQIGVGEGISFATDLINQAGRGGITWAELWPRVLEEKVITFSDLGDAICQLRKEGRITIPAWTPKKRKPDDDYRFFATDLLGPRN